MIPKSLVTVPEKTLDPQTAIQAMSYFGVRELTYDEKMMITDYICEQYHKIHCCVLYDLNTDFRIMCKKLHLDIGLKEVLITESGSIRYTPNYKLFPNLVNQEKK